MGLLWGGRGRSLSWARGHSPAEACLRVLGRRPSSMPRLVLVASSILGPCPGPAFPPTPAANIQAKLEAIYNIMCDMRRGISPNKAALEGDAFVQMRGLEAHQLRAGLPLLGRQGHACHRRYRRLARRLGGHARRQGRQRLARRLGALRGIQVLVQLR